MNFCMYRGHSSKLTQKLNIAKQLASHADRREGLFKEHSFCGLIIRRNSKGKRIPYPTYFSIDNTET